MQGNFDLSPTEEHRANLNKANANLRRILHPQEIFRHQKSRLKWLEEGDRNTAFYHAAVQGGRSRNYIYRLRVNGHSPSVREVLQDDNHHLCSLIDVNLSHLQLTAAADTCVWIPSRNGAFSTKSAYNLSRSYGVKRMPLLRIWHPFFSRRASLFCWQMLYRAVPVDSCIVECGIPLPSRCCCCCCAPQVEDMNHLFLNRDLAKPLWQWLSPLFVVGLGIRDNISISLWNILKSYNLSGPHGFVTIYCSILLLWELWKTRCKMKFEQVSNSPASMRYNIHECVSLALGRMAFKHSSTPQQLDAIRHLGFLVNVSPKMTKFVRWIPPLHGLMLNVDGASKGNPGPCGGGGIFRDPNGNVSMAFSHYYGAGSSISAEVRAMHDGVLFAIEKGFSLSSICSDSLILVNSLRTGVVPFWDCYRWWRLVLDFVQLLGVPVNHVFREANQHPYELVQTLELGLEVSLVDLSLALLLLLVHAGLPAEVWDNPLYYARCSHTSNTSPPSSNTPYHHVPSRNEDTPSYCWGNAEKIPDDYRIQRNTAVTDTPPSSSPASGMELQASSAKPSSPQDTAPSLLPTDKPC
ncbi:hypothetical protein Taro_016630 [Colocasia esculenta]|uniref:Uncharacterized protein n=1 Tax=Colocasia esculenta TaxID=4460 RepID=A0A843UP14_COLES|nr:hypothetical protein [Colocasia esculenta]